MDAPLTAGRRRAARSIVTLRMYKSPERIRMITNDAQTECKDPTRRQNAGNRRVLGRTHQGAGERCQAFRHVMAALCSILLATSADVRAQARGPAADNERESAFVEALRQEDPAGAERYITLRDARAKAVGELERAQQRYNAVGPELRAVALPQLRQAQRTYAESSLALLEFLDARDRRLLENYQVEMSRINKILEERARARDEFQRLLRGN